MVCLALVICAFVWRIPHALVNPIVQVDEVSFSLPTVQRMAGGDWVFYVSGTNYGAPIQEAIASVLFRTFGESAGSFRFPTVLLGSIAVGVFFLGLRRANTGAALGIGLLLALGNSATIRYTTFAHSNYAALLLLVGLVQLATLWTDRQRTWVCWGVLGSLMGLAFYSLKLSIFQSMVSLFWLWIRSDYYKSFRAGLQQKGLLQRFRGGLFVWGSAIVLVLPVLYHWLTRRASFVIAPWEKIIVAAAGLLLLTGTILVFSSLCVPRLPEWGAAAGCVLLLILIPVPAQIWFQREELPRLAAKGISLYPEARYNIKHLHEWPMQARILVQGVFPALIVGRWNEVRGYEETEPLSWKSLLAIGILGPLAFLGLCRWRRNQWRLNLRSPDILFIAPFLITLAVLFPSWSLHSESSFRYLLPYLPGFYLLGFRCIEGSRTTRKEVSGLTLTLYLAYCALDCVLHIV